MRLATFGAAVAAAIALIVLRVPAFVVQEGLSLHDVSRSTNEARQEAMEMTFSKFCKTNDTVMRARHKCDAHESTHAEMWLVTFGRTYVSERHICTSIACNRLTFVIGALCLYGAGWLAWRYLQMQEARMSLGGAPVRQAKKMRRNPLAIE